MKLAFVGGTGPEGLGLAMRFAHAGHEVAIGSRSTERGEEGAQKVRDAVPGATATGGTNADIVPAADIVFLTFPYSGQEATLADLGSALAGKIVCNVAAPLEFQKGIGAVALSVPGNSAAQEAAQQLPDSRVVSGFQNLSAEKLQELDHPIEADVLVCGRDAEAKALVVGLANEIKGARGIDAGGLLPEPLRRDAYRDAYQPQPQVQDGVCHPHRRHRRPRRELGHARAQYLRGPRPAGD
ncbi:MAG: NADPH-dependent F420 reductase [Dehalococcoidia bacterium]|nr:NADPH-dependent F420 reductase [Dehalococcoidia bacterium]